MKNKDIIGLRFGKLLVKGRKVERVKGRIRTYSLCLCDCGNEKHIRQDGLVGGAVKSCGCNFTGKLIVKCSNCGKEIERWKSETHDIMYCSSECKSEWQRNNFKDDKHPNYKGGKITKKCPICNKSFEVWPKDNHIQYCSRKCYGEYLSTLRGAETTNWKGAEYYQAERKTPEYKEWRLSVIDRDFYTCQKCGASSVWLNAHHIKPFHSCEEDRLDIDNGITLCHDCHWDFHNKYSRIDFNKDDLMDYLLIDSLGSKEEYVK